MTDSETQRHFDILHECYNEIGDLKAQLDAANQLRRNADKRAQEAWKELKAANERCERYKKALEHAESYPYGNLLQYDFYQEERDRILADDKE